MCEWEAVVSDTVPPQCCCYFTYEPNIHKCLPHAIIVGAQKAGTTALFAHMLLRKDFERPKVRRRARARRVGYSKSHFPTSPHSHSNTFTNRRRPLTLFPPCASRTACLRTRVV